MSHSCVDMNNAFYQSDQYISVSLCLLMFGQWITQRHSFHPIIHNNDHGTHFSIILHIYKALCWNKACAPCLFTIGEYHTEELKQNTIPLFRLCFFFATQTSLLYSALLLWPKSGLASSSHWNEALHQHHYDKLNHFYWLCLNYVSRSFDLSAKHVLTL